MASGFLGSMNGTGGTGYWGGLGYPFVYDRSAINGASQPLLNTTLFPNPSAALGAQLASNNVFFNGLNARNANGGIAPKLYAPNPWVSGSSYSHLDESTYPNGTLNSLMTPALGPGEAIHDLGPIVRGMFLDMGWTASQPDPGAITGDWDSDGRADITVYRPSTAGWWILRSSSNYTMFSGYGWGGPGDIPVPADYDGDGKTDAAIYRPSTGRLVDPVVQHELHHVRRLWVGAHRQTFRSPPITTEMERPTLQSIAHPMAGWWILWSSTNYTTYGVYGWGHPGDIPVPADYDGDGKTDIAIYRPSNGRLVDPAVQHELHHVQRLRVGHHWRHSGPRRLRRRWKDRHCDLSPVQRPAGGSCGPARITPRTAATGGASLETFRSPPITTEMGRPTLRSIARPTPSGGSCGLVRITARIAATRGVSAGTSPHSSAHRTHKSNYRRKDSKRTLRTAGCDFRE